MKNNPVLLALISAVSAVTLLTGCAGYRLGSMLPPDIRTVYVPTFINKTSEPRAEIEATQRFLEQLQVDGSLRVTSEETADSILFVTLTDYELEPISYTEDRETRANEYRAILTASVVLKKQSTDEVIVSAGSVKGETTFDFLGDIASSKRNAMPDAAQDLAHDLVETIVEQW